ncbi:glutamine amidotransferase [Acinetobacter baumannii]|nr:glutamine amidotransferase [Acinetobacter baumannii]
MLDCDITSFRKIYIFQLGTPPDNIRELQGDISDWFYTALKDYVDYIEVIRVFEGAELPEPNPKCIAILTGSWAMVTDKEPWSERTAIWVRNAISEKMPIFGVCYGHQLIAYALGGEINYHSDGIEIGCKNVQLSPLAQKDPLFRQFPLHFSAYLTHRQTVTKLPGGALNIASSQHDRHQIIRYNSTTISTQFHPEFTFEIAETLILKRCHKLQEDGLNINSLRKELKSSTPEARKLLINFIEAHFFKTDFL